MSNKIKVALLIPCYGDPKGKFVASLAALISYFYQANITDADGKQIERELETFFISSSMLTESRHRLVAEALAWGANYVLWMDADHVFPKDALARLWAQNKMIVGCNYGRRCIPTAPTAAKHITDDDDHDDKNLVYTTLEKAQNGYLEEVDHIGFGLCLMDARCFDMLQIDAEADGKESSLPWFKFEVNELGSSVIGEDVYFFNKLRKAGIKVYVDHGLSWEVGHITDFIVTNALADKQRDKWAASQKLLIDKFATKADELEKAD